jgi:putative endonuclease
MFAVYVIQHDETKEMYIGHTKDLRRRLSEHNRGLQTATKRNSGAWILIYAEAYRDLYDAIVREHQLKNHGRAKQQLYKRIPNSRLQ